MSDGTQPSHEHAAGTEPALGLEPEDLDGHTLEQLEDYLDAGRRPVDPSIERSAGCQLALEAMESVRRLTPALLAAEVDLEPADESWVQQILNEIVLDVRAGRRIPLSHPAPGADLGVTEGAVRSLVRAAENAVPGVLIGRCKLIGDVTTPGTPITLAIDVSVSYGQSVATVAAELREEIGARLRDHTELDVTGIDITIRDIRIRPRSDDDRG